MITLTDKIARVTGRAMTVDGGYTAEK